MNVFYTTDNKFVPQVAASICSLFENNKEFDRINVYVASMGVTPENQQKLQDFAKRYGREVSFIEIGDLSSYIDFSFDTSGWNSIVLARLVLDRLLSESVDRVLYLDGDTIVLDDLEKLWNTDMGGCVIGACIEPTVSASRRVNLDMKDHPYFNAGVLLIDLKKWRKQRTGSKILEYYRQREGKLFANDQDAINGSLAGEIYALDARYNYCNTFDFYPYRALKKLASPAPYISEQEYNDTKARPAIIHYLGEERPWRAGNTHKYAADFRRYLSLTPWADMPMEDGWETYFKCFKIFNAVTRPFPMLRYKIIDSLIPVFMRRRAKQLKKQKEDA